MKEERDMPQSDSLKSSGGLLQSAGFENSDVLIHPSDEDINRIASMPLEQIKSELARMGALDIPIPSRSALCESIGISSKCEAKLKRRKRAIWSPSRLKEMRHAWLGSGSSPTVRVGVRGLALASLILIVSGGAALHLLKPEDHVTIQAPVVPDLLDMVARIPETSGGRANRGGHPESLRDKAPPAGEGPETRVASDVAPPQGTPGRRGQRTGTHTRPVARLEASRRAAREPEGRTPRQQTATSNLTRLVLERTRKGKQEEIMVSKMEVRQPFNE